MHWRAAAESTELPTDCAELQRDLLDSSVRIRDDIEREVGRALQSTRWFADQPALVEALRRLDVGRLRRLANEAVTAAVELDAVLVFDRDGRMLALSEVDTDGTPIDPQSIREVLGEDLSEREVIARCLHNDSDRVVVEFQTDCDITPRFFGSSGLAVAISVPVCERGGAANLGVVSARLRVDRLTACIDAEPAHLERIWLVGDNGQWFDEDINSGRRAPPVDPSTVRAMAADLQRSGAAEALTFGDHADVLGLLPLPSIETIEGGSAFVLTIREQSMLAQARLEAAHGDLTQHTWLAALILAFAATLLYARQARRTQQTLDDVGRELRDTQDRLRTATEHTGIAVWEWDIRRERLHWERSMFALLGVDESTTPSLDSFCAAATPADRERLHAQLSAAIVDGHDLDVEFRVDAGSAGEFRQLEALGTVERDERGRACRIVGLLRDVSERARAAEALCASADFARGIVDGLSAHIAVLDASGEVLAANQHWRNSQRADDSVQRGVGLGHYFDVCSGRTSVCNIDARNVSNGIRRVLDGTLEHFEYEYACVEAAAERWFVARVTRFCGEGAVRIVVAHEDVTLRRRTEDQLRHSEQLLRQMGRIARVGGWSLEVGSQRLRWTDEVFRVHEIDDRDQPLDLESTLECFAPEAQPEIRAALFACVERRQSFQLELRMFTTRGRERWVRMLGEPSIVDGDVVRIVGALQDVTDEREARAELESARQIAEAASLSKSTFVANMSHEIRTPMTAIVGYAELLTADDLSTEQRHDYVKTIVRNGDHLLAIVNDILDISKIEAGKMTVESVDCSPIGLVEQVVELMRVRAHGKRLELEAEYLGRLPRIVRTDPVRLRQILMNIVGNALKFTETGGVRIEVGLDEVQNSAPGDAELTICVRDTGIGMTAEQAHTVFDAFTQADPSMTRRFGGTGLGLRISQSLIEILGGSIHVASEFGVGTTMTLRLPIAGELAADTIDPAIERRALTLDVDATTSQATDGACLEGLRILLAEDGRDNQKLITFLLRKAGAEVAVVDNGRAAIDALLDRDAESPAVAPPSFDLVLMDVQMPEMDGEAATRELRLRGFDRPIIALTAHAMAGDRLRCLEFGCSDYTTKPVQRVELLRLCRMWAQRARTDQPRSSSPSASSR